MQDISPAAHQDAAKAPAGRATVTLSGNLGIRDADQLRADLLRATEDGGTLRITLGALTGADTSILQVLIAGRRYALARGGQVEISGFDDSPLPGLMAALGLAPANLVGPPDARA